MVCFWSFYVRSNGLSVSGFSVLSMSALMVCFGLVYGVLFIYLFILSILGFFLMKRVIFLTVEQKYFFLNINIKSNKTFLFHM